jgi:hypothetical protein
MSQPYFALNELSNDVHLATAVMRNNKLPISANAFVKLIVDLK